MTAFKMLQSNQEHSFYLRIVITDIYQATGSSLHMGKFMHMLFNPHPLIYYPHLTDKETEAQRGIPKGLQHKMGG